MVTIVRLFQADTLDAAHTAWKCHEYLAPEAAAARRLVGGAD